MKSITGRGTRERTTVEARIICNDNSYRVRVSGDNKELYDTLRSILKGDIKVGGTYIIPQYTLLKAYYALDKFFDEGWTYQAQGKLEEIPWEPGKVY